MLAHKSNHRCMQHACSSNGARPAALGRSRMPTKTSRFSRKMSVKAGAEFGKLQDITVYNAGSGDPVNITSLWQADQGAKAVIPFLTHFADLTSWEYARKIVAIMPMLESSGVKVFAVGLGNASNAQEFSKYMRFPMDKLYADPTGAAYKALGFNPGFMPEAQISPFAKLIPMLAGIGSPGTVEEVIRGYLGDKEAKPVFDAPTPFDMIGLGFQRPFELATLRLFNMFSVLSKWSDLSPPQQTLLTQQGGTLAFEGENTIFRHDDSGILKRALTHTHTCTADIHFKQETELCECTLHPSLRSKSTDFNTIKPSLSKEIIIGPDWLNHRSLLI